jgi:membrane protease YdiL (CAAX protease family)
VDIIVAGIFLFGVIILANVLDRRGDEREQFYFSLLLLLFNIPVFFTGLLLLLTPADTFNRVAAEVGLNLSNGAAFGLVLLLIALWGIAVCLAPVRRVLARVTRLRPQSAVHTLALVLVGYLVGQGALALSQGGLEGLAENAQPNSVYLVAAQELLFALLALLGVGFVIRRRGRALAQRLGLEKPEPLHWLVGLGWIGILVVLQFLVSLVYAALDPEQSQTLESVNSMLLAQFDTIWEWFFLAIAAGVGEELLFRGALQPVFGLVTTSIMFGLIHVQYGLSPLTLFVALLALILGLIRRNYSTTIAIFVHVGYDFVLGLLVLLATYLQQFAS